MELILKQILQQQEKNKCKLLVDIRLFNGNILLKSFHITGLDPAGEKFKGLTAQEEYSHPREGREPEYCTLAFSEIKELICPELELQYQAGELV